uniref:DUF4220 domain-containing protein n=1 Tax=Ananas comosus var. bracteatus TaxID=296719 RepID=A0A6V7NKM1_ANACO|nr:unnamed protein product [Ananas comosus var. bracteatus]
MSACPPAPSSTDDNKYCHNFTPSRESQVQQPTVCLTPQDWEVIFEIAAIGIAASLLLGFLVAATRHKLWHRSGTLKCFLDFVRDTLYSWLDRFAVLLLPPPLYGSPIIWTVLLYATYGCFYSVLGYSLYGHDKKKAMLTHEKKQLANNGVVLVLLLIVTDYRSDISKILFAIWGLSMLKIIGRIFSFRAAEKSYGTANTKLVAVYMKHEHKQGARFDPSNMEGYKYLVIGEEQQAEPERPSYEPKLRNDAAVTTVEDVWRCKGRLFKGSSRGRYRDMCLSFALFKPIKMRFDGHPQVEDESKSRALIRDGLLSEHDDGKRAFEVIKSELGFLRDLFHTKHPVASNPWILICNFVLYATIAMSIWIAMRIDLKKHAEHPITKVLVSLLILAEIWEFISYLFSDWGKVILIGKYVNYHLAFDRYHVDKILRVILWRNLSCRSLYEKLEQFSLLNSLNSCCTCSRCCYLLVYCLPGTSRKPNQRFRKEKPIQLKAEVKKAIFLSLKKLLASERVVLTNGITTLAELGHDKQLGWACGLGDHAHADEHTHMHTIMIWHIATALCEMKLPPKNKKGEGLRSELESRAAVANSLSKYCAYLVVFAPEFLPIHGHSSKIMFKQMFAEACEACPPRGICRKITYDDVVNIKYSDAAIISKGAKLGKQLMDDIEEDAKRWELLERFWAELILFLAPSKDAMAHASKLEEGGEFITQLWALLYHARVEKRFPEKNEHDGEHV